MSADRDVPELGELVRTLFAAIDSGADFDDLLTHFTVDAVFDASPMGMEKISGREGMRAQWETWTGAFEDFLLQPEEIRELGSGIVLAATYERGRPRGSSGEVEMRQGWVIEFTQDRVRSLTLFPTPDEARAVAERLL